jgi:hypothetical protein
MLRSELKKYFRRSAQETLDQNNCFSRDFTFFVLEKKNLGLSFFSYYLFLKYSSILESAVYSGFYTHF